MDAAAKTATSPYPTFPVVSGQQPPTKNFIQNLPYERRAQLFGGFIIILGVVIGGAAIAIGAVMIKKAVPLPMAFGSAYYYRGTAFAVVGVVSIVAMTATAIFCILEGKRPHEKTELEITPEMIKDSGHISLPMLKVIFQNNPNLKDLKFGGGFKTLPQGTIQCLPQTIETLELSLANIEDWSATAISLLSRLSKLTQLTIKVNYNDLNKKHIELVILRLIMTPNHPFRKLVLFCESEGKPLLNLDFCRQFADHYPCNIGTTSRGHEFTAVKHT